MTQSTGTYDISILLAARFQSVAQFGMNTVAEILAADLAAHNLIVSQMMSDLCDISTDRQRIYGSSVDGEMTEVDEYGRAATQLARPGDTVGFPLGKFQYNIGWTRDYLEQATPADMAIRQQAAQKAHLRGLQKQVKKAIFANTNYTFIDHLVDKVSLSVKRFSNADSSVIPNGPNGEVFDGASHQHYLATANLVASDLTTLIQTVVEHGHGGAVRLVISRTDEAAVRLLAGFTKYEDPRLIFGASTTGIANQRADISRLDNRAIGIFDAAEVWVKPWAIAGYIFAYDSGTPAKPLVFRQPTSTTLQGLRIAAEFDTHPLQAQVMEDKFGIGVWNRTNGAILYTGGGAWTDPTIS